MANARRRLLEAVETEGYGDADNSEVTRAHKRQSPPDTERAACQNPAAGATNIIMARPSVRSICRMLLLTWVLMWASSRTPARIACAEETAAQPSRPWLIVSGDDEPVAVTDNVARLQQELSVLAGQAVGLVSASSLTETERKQCDLVVVGHVQRNALAREILSASPSDDSLEHGSPLAREQGYVVTVEPACESRGAVIAAVGRGDMGAVYGVSHLRTRMQSSGSRLRLDVDGKPTSTAAFRQVYCPRFEERAVYYNMFLNDTERLTPSGWSDDDWQFWIDKLVCSQLTHIYFFLWSDSLYFTKSSVTGAERNRVLYERLTAMIRHAHRRGLKVVYHVSLTQIPHDIFEANKDVVKATIEYVDHGFPIVCSAAPGKIVLREHQWNNARELIADIYSQQIERFREADGFQIWFYDPGGCFCGPEKQNCASQQAARLMEQMRSFHAMVRRVNPRADLTVSLWPTWVLEPTYKVQYRDEFLDLLAAYARDPANSGTSITVNDSLNHERTGLPLARQRGFRLNGFVFPTNVESGCVLFTPMLAFLKQTVKRGEGLGISAIHHMRIEESSKFANTFFASCYFWNPDLAPEDVLRHYVRWIANTNAESADKLYQAITLLDSFMCDGAEKQDHTARGAEIGSLVEAAFRSLPADKSQQHEWLLATARAAAIIGEAVDHPDRMEALSPRFDAIMRDSPTFAHTATPLKHYVKWITRGWTLENF